MSRALQTDLYQLTMAAGYFARGMQGRTATCEMFVRRLPTARRYLVVMGVERLVTYLEQLRFTDEDIAFLRDVPSLRDAMTPAFEAYLRDFRFTGDVDAMPEGTVGFENEPFVRVRAPLIEAQAIETFALSAINHATMIASKAARIVHAAGDATVVEFGTRRTHYDAAVDAARAAFAVGFSGTSNVEAARAFGIPVLGTAAHMWTMAHDSEEEAFASYVSVFPNASILLIDTYDTERGAQRAAAIAKDKLRGVRIDSGNLDVLSRKVRAILDEAGCTTTKIVVSGDLNEHSIAALRAAGAPIDTYGIGTELVASVDAPALGGVYKLVELVDGARVHSVAKFSSGKVTYPGPHQVQRVSAPDGTYERDILSLADEPLAPNAEGLLVPFVRGGKRVRAPEPLADVQRRARASMAKLPRILLDLGPKPHDQRFLVEPSTTLAALVDRVRQEVMK
ncbi:MAG: nicotinate phosphoribosyltransferase [Polyangiaceae bacterium]